MKRVVTDRTGPSGTCTFIPDRTTTGEACGKPAVYMLLFAGETKRAGACAEHSAIARHVEGLIEIRSLW